MDKKLSDLSPEDKLLRAGQTFIWKREKEYIDKAVLIKAIGEADCDVMADYGPEHGAEWGFSREVIKKIVQDCPTADVVEVRHGEWIPVDEQYDAFDCSECEAMVSRMMNYCPRCGARMTGESENA